MVQHSAPTDVDGRLATKFLHANTVRSSPEKRIRVPLLGWIPQECSEGRLAQRKSSRFTPERSGVQIPQRPPIWEWLSFSLSSVSSLCRTTGVIGLATGRFAGGVSDFAPHQICCFVTSPGRATLRRNI